MLVIFSGCSGVGKNTVINNLLSKTDEYKLLPTYTTRDKRPGEKDGVPYYFTTKDAFREKIANGDFYEHEIVHTNYYGTSRALLAEGVASGKTLMKDIDVNGALNLSEMLKNDIKIVTLFLYVESEEILVERLTGRGEKDIALRLERYNHEMSKQRFYSYLINNVSLEGTSTLVNEIVSFEKGEGKLSLAKVCENISENAVREALTLYENGDTPAPIRVNVCEGKFVITEGAERFIASLITKKNIAKDLVLAENKEMSDFDIYSYADNFRA